MHGSCLPLSSSKLTTTFLPLLLQNPCSSQHHTTTTRSSSSITLICGFGGHEFTPIRKASKRGRSVFTVRAASRESPYQVLGVSPSATPQQIKAAYRKLALKLHPDVNKEPNAQEKFMRVKHAYNTLLNSEARRSDYSYSTTEGSRNRKSQDEEEFYGLGNFMKDVQITIEDFFRDIQTEFKNWEASADSQGKPKSLWEELADIGEEFVEFLEKELNITDSDTETETENKDSSKRNQYEKSRSEQSGSNAVKESSIEDNIDDIEATLAQLKRELGL